LRHIEKSKEYEYKRQFSEGTANFKVWYGGSDCNIRMRETDPMRKALLNVNEKFGTIGYVFYYNNIALDLILPAIVFDEADIELAPKQLP